MSPRAEAVAGRLETTWFKWWMFSMGTGVVLAIGTSIALMAFFALFVAILRPPQAVLVVLSLIWLGLTVTIFGGLVVRLVRFHRSLEATARRIEIECPELGSQLINLVQLSEANGKMDEDWRNAAVARAAESVGDFHFEAASTKESRWQRFVLCMQTPRDLAESVVALFAIGGLMYGLFLLVPTCSSATSKLLHPWAFVPTVGSIKIIKVTPGDTEALLGTGVDVAAEIDKAPAKPPRAILYVRGEKGPETSIAMLPDAKNQKFVASIPQVSGPLRYRLEIGDSQSDRYNVNVYEKPTVTSVDITYDFPPYIGREKETHTQKQADIEAPQLTTAELKVHPSVPIAHGHIMVGDEKVFGRTIDDGKTMVADLLLKDSGTFTIHLFTDNEHTDPEPRVNRIRVLPDAPPVVQIAEPARESSVAAGTKQPIIIRASDDYGLGEVRIELKSGDEAAAKDKPEAYATWTKFSDPTNVTLTQDLVIDPAKYKPGQSVVFRAVALDKRSFSVPGQKFEPQEASTAWYVVHLLDPQAKLQADVAQLDSVRVALSKIFQQQIRTQIGTIEVAKSKDLSAALASTAEVRKQQTQIQKDSIALVATIGEKADEDTTTIKKVLNKLAFGDMLEAVRQSEALEQAKTLDKLPEPAGKLRATQDKIVDVLRRLLNEIRKDTADKLAEMGKRSDTELPPDAKGKLEELKDKLDEFLKQQKKVIEATEDLAKKPVDDFTEKEKELLAKLAAIEDDWSKFLADKHTDLSKLPEQDFSNPSMLQEMVEVQTELKMAKDALTKKTADIAVPLEQLGAEMAKEMTTNIEKWLPDTPDREKWSQEEPLTDDMKEAPMAELPKELEDIVGDLMEQEEDVFDEMEDASSSWADSLDKGAGWDAMDGPISNNSARGVTGNRLPNTSEIAGRSGEGRQGKASGEFVGDTAVGKGGRKTPSRLTPDAFVKGQVKDVSKDPVGGATGGGKESGVGGEGLQGPVPNKNLNSNERLASKQASLRNKAEGVDLKFKVMKYHHTDLGKLIDQMGSVEADLKAGKYQNALRRRDMMLSNLDQMKMYLKGEFVIRQDQTSNLPTEIQKEILGSMSEASPAGWEELNRQYFERLGQAKPAAAPASAPAANAEEKK